jgi:hypothetical protein
MRKKKEAMSTAFSEVLASVQQDAPAGIIRPADPGNEKAAPRGPELEQPESQSDVSAAPPPAETSPESGVVETPSIGDEGPVHRRLIRATLPRTADAPATRPVPQFTMREPVSRGGHFRSKGGPRPHQGGGARPHGRPVGPKQPGGSRKGGFGSHPHPSRPGHGAHAPRPGKKHSR